MINCPACGAIAAEKHRRGCPKGRGWREQHQPYVEPTAQTKANMEAEMWHVPARFIPFDPERMEIRGGVAYWKVPQEAKLLRDQKELVEKYGFVQCKGPRRLQPTFITVSPGNDGE